MSLLCGWEIDTPQQFRVVHCPFKNKRDNIDRQTEILTEFLIYFLFPPTRPTYVFWFSGEIGIVSFFPDDTTCEVWELDN